MEIISKNSMKFSLNVILVQIYNNIGQIIFKNNLTYKIPHDGPYSNGFWRDLMKFQELRVNKWLIHFLKEKR